MASTVYETMFILDSNRYARDPNGVSGQLSEMIEKIGGDVLVSRLWNEQKLAYSINGQHKGTYWLTYFRVESSDISPLTRACQLNENILRQLTLKVDPRLVDALVAHAQGREAVAPKSEGADESKSESEADDTADDAEAVAAGE